MGLDLSNVGVVQSGRVAELQSAFELLEEVEQYVEKELGVPEYKQPTSVPEDLGDGLADRADTLSSEELAILHTQYVAYASFLHTRLARVKAAYKLADRNKNNIKADISEKMFAQKVPKAEVPQRVMLDPLFQEFEIEYLKLYMMREILEARYSAYDKQAAAISRIISLREQELNRSGRDAALGKRKSRVRRPLT